MDGYPQNGMSHDDDPGDMDEVILNEDDILETIELDDEQNGAVNDMGLLEMEDDDKDDEDDAAMLFEPERDDSSLIFSKHTGSVFCGKFAPKNSDYAVTGGEDDKAYVWTISTGEVILECTGHKDSVTYVSFSADASYLATGDLSGLIQVWDMQQLKCIWSFEVSDLEWISWHQVAPVLLAGTVDGDIWMWKIPSGDTKTFQSFGCPCNVGKFMPDGKRCVTGYDDGSIRIWDLKAGTPIHTFSGHTGHQSSITDMMCHNDNTLVITGSTDGTSNILNTNTGKVAACFKCRVETDGDCNDDSVESVGLSNVFPFAATGTLSGCLDIWDIPTQVCRQKCKHDAGIVKLSWAESLPLVYTCTLDGTVQLWDARTGSRERKWLGHKASILSMDIRSDGRVMTTSDDFSARVYMS